MTECERIIREGILPKSFFEEEIICGFKVTEERKKLFAVLLDILLKMMHGTWITCLFYIIIHLMTD